MDKYTEAVARREFVFENEGGYAMCRTYYFPNGMGYLATYRSNIIEGMGTE